MINTYNPSITEKDGAPEKFIYEYRMFMQSYNVLLNSGEPNNPVLRNMSLETTLLHARNLLDFFCGNPTINDNIRANHFVTKENENEIWTSTKSSYLISSKSTLTKVLATSHILVWRGSRNGIYRKYIKRSILLIVNL